MMQFLAMVLIACIATCSSLFNTKVSEQYRINHLSQGNDPSTASETAVFTEERNLNSLGKLVRRIRTNGAPKIASAKTSIKPLASKFYNAVNLALDFAKISYILGANVIRNIFKKKLT
ncbi:hypothetical protein CCR75_008378 [Bremia lactucae]|uniref:RxLR effector protein n=1 Tax=Bremia lactucae TaxID=4779 RepID=A0A976FGG1_BRELC|nr:hypothetical protein CCR75_008378 [Bremia lactucae]